MICFPFEFQQLTPYHGYYFNTKDNEVYSIKSGTLKKLKSTTFFPAAYMKKPELREIPNKNERHWFLSINNRSQIIYKKEILELIEKNAKVYFLPVKGETC